MKFTKLVVAYLCVLVAATDGSLITNFISTASNFWPKLKGEKSFILGKKRICDDRKFSFLRIEQWQ